MAAGQQRALGGGGGGTVCPFLWSCERQGWRERCQPPLRRGGRQVAPGTHHLPTYTGSFLGKMMSRTPDCSSQGNCSPREAARRTPRVIRCPRRAARAAARAQPRRLTLDSPRYRRLDLARAGDVILAEFLEVGHVSGVSSPPLRSPWELAARRWPAGAALVAARARGGWWWWAERGRFVIGELRRRRAGGGAVGRWLGAMDGCDAECNAAGCGTMESGDSDMRRALAGVATGQGRARAGVRPGRQGRSE